EMMARVQESGRTLDEILVIASLIERETDGTDRAKIASVIYNRLNNVGETYHLLQIDASLIYGLGDQYTGKLTEADLAFDSPYNLSTYPYLPPTPIGNPGLAAIEAALDPAETGYYFYARGQDNLHHFFRTYEEHLAFVNSSDYKG
ncbi:MAG: endolytic transglycosylase MltG, partial [Oscillospiraceae bacterium]|nr:endolytic transglycosylase MltG [Oscillospiraceae bacterium]